MENAVFMMLNLPLGKEDWRFFYKGQKVCDFVVQRRDAVAGLTDVVCDFVTDTSQSCYLLQSQTGTLGYDIGRNAFGF